MKRFDSDRSFWLSLQMLAYCYAAFLLWILLTMASRVSFGDVAAALSSDGILVALKLSLFTSCLSALIATIVSVPVGYVLARRNFPARSFIESVCTIPIAAPPLVLGLGLLIFFQSAIGRLIENNVWVFTFRVSGIVLAQSLIATAFAIQTMHAVFRNQSDRSEQIALTFGCRRAQAFWRVAIPEARHGIQSTALTAWTHCMGIFGPILVFAGMIRGRTEVLSTTVWLELQNGNLEAAIVASLLLISMAVIASTLARQVQASSELADD